MAHAAIAADFGQTLDVKRHLTTQITLDHIGLVDDLTMLRLVGLSQILYASVGVDACLREDILRTFSSNTIDISQTDLDSLILGQVNTGNTCHTF